MKATEQELTMLLERAGLASIDASGTRSKAASKGGIVARIHISGVDNPELSISIGDVRAAAHFPIDEKRVAVLLEPLQAHRAIPHHAAFTHMLSHLLVNVARMYLASGAKSLTLDAVHLHENGYHIDDVELLHDQPLHLKPRVEATGRDSTFTHTQRDSMVTRTQRN